MSSSSVVLQSQMPALVACTVSRDVQTFDLLIEDMEATLGESWGDLSFSDAASFLQQPEAAELQFLAIALDQQDENSLEQIIAVIATAKARGLKVILITDDLNPSILHKLLREGGDEFVPYPLPEGELSAAIDRVLAPEPHMPATTDPSTDLKATGNKEGVLIAVHGLSGGTGATTLAVNLAWELANVEKENAPRICILDFDFQFGTASTYLDLPRREAVIELLNDTEAMDSASFMQALLPYEEKLFVLTAPTDMIPLDLVSATDIGRLIEIARTNFDYVVIDMPPTMVEWSQTVLEAAHVYLATIELDMRSAQNTLRLKRALQAEDLPFEKLRFVLNRAPGFTDLNGKSRVKRLAESLDIAIEVMMPDGGKQVAQMGDHGTPLSINAPKNPLRKEIAKLAKSIHAVNQDAVAEAKG